MGTLISYSRTDNGRRLVIFALDSSHMIRYETNVRLFAYLRSFRHLISNFRCIWFDIFSISRQISYRKLSVILRYVPEVNSHLRFLVRTSWSSHWIMELYWMKLKIFAAPSSQSIWFEDPRLDCMHFFRQRTDSWIDTVMSLVVEWPLNCLSKSFWWSSVIVYLSACPRSTEKMKSASLIGKTICVSLNRRPPVKIREFPTADKSKLFEKRETILCKA